MEGREVAQPGEQKMRDETARKVLKKIDASYFDGFRRLASKSRPPIRSMRRVGEQGRAVTIGRRLSPARSLVGKLVTEKFAGD